MQMADQIHVLTDGGVDLTDCPGHRALSGHQVVIQAVQASV